MGKLLDLTGKTFGRLTGVKRVANRSGYGQAVWLFRCACGNETALLGYSVVHGGAKSCGCLRSECKSRLKHGMSKTAIFHSWASMRQRCNNKNALAYPDYGGRGIKICVRWESFDNFYADMGERPIGTTLDRKNNDGDYCKDNCRWETKKEQVRNRRVTPIYSYKGVSLSLADWADMTEISYQTLWVRHKNGWRDERLFSPVRGSN